MNLDKLGNLGSRTQLICVTCSLGSARLDGFWKTTLNNLKTKVDDFDVGKLKTVAVDFKKLIGIVNNEVVKNTKFNTLKTKVSNSEKKFLMQLL